ncbi:MAG: hypothetical protein IKD87_06230 [Oscillospiraceae bacterium]|nr:hypothetical protein [Oscillospiraceae bacterium]
MEIKREDITAYSASGAFEREARNYFDEYFELTGTEFPACDRNRWSSLDEWLTDLKLAVYREQAIREVYGNIKNPQGSESGAFRAG